VTAGELAEHDRIRTALYHYHRPALDAAGLVEFEPDTGRAERTDLTQACVLLARETDSGYDGFWSGDAELVPEVLETLDTAVGDSLAPC
jgi:hypothetical protein